MWDYSGWKWAILNYLSFTSDWSLLIKSLNIIWLIFKWMQLSSKFHSQAKLSYLFKKENILRLINFEEDYLSCVKNMIDNLSLNFQKLMDSE